MADGTKPSPVRNLPSVKARREQKHAAAEARAIAHIQRPRRNRKLFGGGYSNSERFGSLPRRYRHLAEAEYDRLYKGYVERTGHEPPTMKMRSMMACAVAIVVNHRIRQHGGPVSNWKRCFNHQIAARRVLDTKGHERNEDIRAIQQRSPEDRKKPPRTAWSLKGV